MSRRPATRTDVIVPSLMRRLMVARDMVVNALASFTET